MLSILNNLNFRRLLYDTFSLFILYQISWLYQRPEMPQYTPFSWSHFVPSSAVQNPWLRLLNMVDPNLNDLSSSWNCQTVFSHTLPSGAYSLRLVPRVSMNSLLAGCKSFPNPSKVNSRRRWLNTSRLPWQDKRQIFHTIGQRLGNRYSTG